MYILLSFCAFGNKLSKHNASDKYKEWGDKLGHRAQSNSKKTDERKKTKQ